jgi:hypothetical protein
MRTLLRFGGLAAVLLALGGCSTSYVVDWDVTNDFSGDRTYAWYELATPRGEGVPQAVPNEIVADRVRRSVTATLEAKGLRPAAAGEADLLVTHGIVLQRGVRIYHSGWGGPYWGCCGWGGGPGWGYTSARSYVKGTLVLDVLDGSRRRLVWRGIAEGGFTRPNPSDERVAEVVARVMESFPPR